MNLLIVLSIFAAVAIVIACRVAFVEYPRSAVDATRNELFSIRDELFELASSGAVSFDHRGYIAARDLINGMIRYAHDVSAVHLIFANLCANEAARHLRRRISASFQRDLDSLPKAAREPVKQILSKASLSLARLVVFRSVGLSVVFAGYVVIHGLREILAQLLRMLQRREAEASCPPSEEHHNNVEDSMRDAIKHGPMRNVPRLVAREAGRYSVRFEMDALPRAA